MSNANSLLIKNNYNIEKVIIYCLLQIHNVQSHIKQNKVKIKI